MPLSARKIGHHSFFDCVSNLFFPPSKQVYPRAPNCTSTSVQQQMSNLCGPGGLHTPCAGSSYELMCNCANNPDVVVSCNYLFPIDEGYLTTFDELSVINATYQWSTWVETALACKTNYWTVVTNPQGIQLQSAVKTGGSWSNSDLFSTYPNSPTPARSGFGIFVKTEPRFCTASVASIRWFRSY